MTITNDFDLGDFDDDHNCNGCNESQPVRNESLEPAEWDNGEDDYDGGVPLTLEHIRKIVSAQ